MLEIDILNPFTSQLFSYHFSPPLILVWVMNRAVKASYQLIKPSDYFLNGGQNT